MQASEDLPTTPWPDLARDEDAEARRLAPGLILEQRYRIVAPIGQGGMGVLYQADDLRLGQRVALKFLAPDVAHDARVVAHLVSEVALGRQIAHPNVCRLYDLIELDGHPCISMEFVEGEDLASLLRRVGRIPSARTIAIARDLASGLAAAHDQGVIHRDLKPANVMIDSRGNVKITDFGLAASTDEVRHAGVVIGTPGYMAPEQLRGEEATPQADLYALGLVLYEMVAGRRAFDAPSLPDLLLLQRSGTPPPLPSSLAPDVDARLERLIVQCLDDDPRKRPASARALLAMLPGGDALTAAIEAGETPTPEAVAAAEIARPLSRVGAAALVAAIVVLTAAAVVATERSAKLHLIDRLLPPEVLRQRAEGIARPFLPVRPDQTEVWRYEQNEGYLAHLEQQDATASRWAPLFANPGMGIRFWYRRGTDLAPWGSNDVVFDDPPHRPGTVAVRIDGEGHLRSFRAPATNASKRGPVDWNAFFREAALDVLEFQPAPPASPPEVAADDVRAWTRPRDGTIVLAGSMRNEPVFFDVRAPWDVGLRSEEALGFSGWIFGSVWAVMSIAGAVMARRNVNRGRGDTRSAWRVSLFVFVTWTLFWAFSKSNAKLFEGIAFGVFAAAEAWLFYVALEPHVRRRWPRVLVGWTRLLAGRVRDPLIARDLLIGFAAAAATRVALNVLTAGLLRAGIPQPRPTEIRYYETLGRNAGEFFFDFFVAVTLALGFLFLLLLVGLAVRRLWIAVAIVATLLALIFLPSGAGAAVLVFIVPLVLLVRFGLLSAVFCLYGGFLQAAILTFDVTRWYSAYSVVALVVFIGLSLSALATVFREGRTDRYFVTG